MHQKGLILGLGWTLLEPSDMAIITPSTPDMESTLCASFMYAAACQV
jgi:hypothetical protein